MKTLLAIGVILLFGLTPTKADTLFFGFTAKVDRVDATLGLSTPFSPGQNVTGSFSVTDASAPIGNSAGYAVTSLSILFPSYSAAGTAGNLTVYNNFDFGNPAVDVLDGYTITSSVSGPAVNGFNASNFQLVFENRGVPPITNLLSLAIPLNPDGVLTFRYSVLQFDGFRNVWLSNYDITQQVVPLPAALPLFAGGLGLLAWMSRRKRKATH